VLRRRSTDFEAEWRQGKYARNVIVSSYIYICLVIISEFYGNVLCFDHDSTLDNGCYIATNLNIFIIPGKKLHIMCVCVTVLSPCFYMLRSGLYKHRNEKSVISQSDKTSVTFASRKRLSCQQIEITALIRDVKGYQESY